MLDFVSSSPHRLAVASVTSQLSASQAHLARSPCQWPSRFFRQLGQSASATVVFAKSRTAPSSWTKPLRLSSVVLGCVPHTGLRLAAGRVRAWTALTSLAAAASRRLLDPRVVTLAALEPGPVSSHFQANVGLIGRLSGPSCVILLSGGAASQPCAPSHVARGRHPPSPPRTLTAPAGRRCYPRPVQAGSPPAVRGRSPRSP